MRRTKARRRRYTWKDLALDALIAVVWIGFWIFIACKALHVIAAPAPVDVRIRDGIRTGYEAVTQSYDDLMTLDRQELADMRTTEEWTEPVIVTVPETAAPVVVPETEPETAAETVPGHFTDRERYLLLHIMMHEAGNQGVIGQALVGRCVINRMQDPAGRFGNSIEAVLFQPGQFGPEPEICRYSPNADSYAALELLEAGWDESQGALFFCTTSFSWATFLFRYGGHSFFV